MNFLEKQENMAETAQVMKQRNLEKLKYLKEVAAHINEHEPAEKARIMEKAEEAMAGMLIIPGSEGKTIFVGNPPAWKSNPTKEKDIEAVYVISRMEHWTYLLKAYLLTKEEKYAKKVVDELMDWLAVCPYSGIPEGGIPEIREVYYSIENEYAPWRSLEVGMRMFMGWMDVPVYLADYDYFTPEKLMSYIEMLYCHQEVLVKVSPRLYPDADHNHYLMEMLGLLYITCDYPEIKGAMELRKFAMDELVRCAKRQLTDEGGQIEGCPHYHNECMLFFTLAVLKAKQVGLEFPSVYISRVEKALEYSLHSLRCNGKSVPWGDSDATETPIRSAVYGCMALKNSFLLNGMKAVFGTQKIVDCAIIYSWEMDELKDLDVYRAEKEEVELNLMNFQKDLNQVMFRTGWNKESASMFFACRTPIENVHQHIDPNAFDFCGYGQNLLVDPGRYTYNDIPERYTYKSAKSHNTVVINGKEPFEYIATWEYGEQKNGIIEHCSEEDSYFYVRGMHENYEPIIHSRHLFMLKNEETPYVFIVDELENCENGDEIMMNYHMDTTNANVVGKYCKANYQEGQAYLQIHTLGNFEAEVEKAHLSEIMDIERESRIARFKTNITNDEREMFLTVLLPMKEDKEVDIKMERNMVTNSFEIVIDDKNYIITKENKDMILG